jgi:ABC-type branched-subunit amino acid transport system substrate-binding protein
LAIVDTTGPTKAFGSQELAGIKAAAKYYNFKGGIDGHKVAVKSVSSNGDPTTATNVAVKALSANPGKYDMVYPGSEGSVVAALTPVMARYNAFAVAIDDPSSVCHDVSKCPHQFANLGGAKPGMVSGAKWINQKHFQTVGILQEQAAFAQTETPAMVQALTTRSIKHKTVNFPKSATDVTSEMSRLKDDGVDVVYAEATGAAAGYVIKARSKLSWNVPIVFDISGSALDLSTLVPKSELDKVYITGCPCLNTSQKAPGLHKLKKFAPNGAINKLPVNLAGDGWDAVVLFANAATQSHSLNYKDVTKAAEHLSKKAQTDPLYVVTQKKMFSQRDHENMAEQSSDFAIMPAGPISGGQLH